MAWYHLVIMTYDLQVILHVYVVFKLVTKRNDFFSNLIEIYKKKYPIINKAKNHFSS
jgi:hypothetical protein